MADTSHDTVGQSYYRVSVKGLILDETRLKFLLVREENGWWELPGGGLDHKEDERDCLRREIKEEMGLDVIWIEEKPSYVLNFYRDIAPSVNKWRVNIVYEMKVNSLSFTPSHECVEIRFVTPDEARQLTSAPNVLLLADKFENRANAG